MKPEIRMLTLWQPWASLIAKRLKRFETRSWSTSYRGLIAIHAAKRPVNKDEVLPIRYAVGGGGCTHEELAAIDECLEATHKLPLGCVVAIAELTGCFAMHQRKTVGTYVDLPGCGHIFIDPQSVLERAVGNWQPGRCAWKLENILALPEPIPAKGGQGLRVIRDRALLEQIGGGSK